MVPHREQKEKNKLKRKQNKKKTGCRYFVNGPNYLKFLDAKEKNMNNK